MGQGGVAAGGGGAPAESQLGAMPKGVCGRYHPLKMEGAFATTAGARQLQTILMHQGMPGELCWGFCTQNKECPGLRDPVVPRPLAARAAEPAVGGAEDEEQPYPPSNMVLASEQGTSLASGSISAGRNAVVEAGEEQITYGDLIGWRPATSS